MVNKHLFQKQMILLKMFLGTRKAQFQQPRWRNFQKMAKLFGQCQKMISKDFSEEKYFTKNPYAHEKTVLSAQPKNILLKVEKFTLNFRK